MIIKRINEVNNWSSPWEQYLKDAVLQGRNSTEVGEYLVFENHQIKVWTIYLPAEQSFPFHKHNKPYLYIALSEGKSRSFYSDGKITETTYNKGDTQHFPDLNAENYFVHNLENIGKTTLIFTTIEFKI